MAHLYLTDDICESFAACVFTLNGLICNPVSYDEEDLGKVGVVWPKNNRVVAVERRNVRVPPYASECAITWSHLTSQ